MPPSTDEPLAGLWATHVVLPVQFLSSSPAARSGEQRLMAAVLEDAIALHFKRIPPGITKLQSKLQQEQAEATRWLRSNDAASAFSFLRICEALHIEPQYLRRGLRTFDEHAIPRPRLARTWAQTRASSRGAARAALG
jgi:hypothetical protein